MSRQRDVCNNTRLIIKLVLFASVISTSALLSNAIAQNTSSANNKQSAEKALQASYVPSSVLKELPDAKKIGAGTLRWFGIRVYDVQLWGNSGGANFDYKKEKYWLELKYARAFEGGKIAERSRDEMEKIGAGTATQLEAWGKQMAAIFPNVESGTKLSAIHFPNAGAKFFKDGNEIGQIQEAEFAEAFFGIWLDKKTSAPAVRERLLGLVTD
jgi:hypothetical protein